MFPLTFIGIVKFAIQLEFSFWTPPPICCWSLAYSVHTESTPCLIRPWYQALHYNDVINRAKVSQITGVSIICSTICLVGDQRKHQSSASLGFVRGIHGSPVDSPHKGPVTRKMFSFMTWPSINMPRLCTLGCLEMSLTSPGLGFPGSK